jgi:hypothetical protein
MFGLVVGLIGLGIALIGTGYAIYNGERMADKADANARLVRSNIQNQKESRLNSILTALIKSKQKSASSWTRALFTSIKVKSEMTAIDARNPKRLKYSPVNTPSSKAAGTSNMWNQFRGMSGQYDYGNPLGGGFGTQGA